MKDATDGPDHLFPAAGFVDELLAAGGGQPVVFRFAIIFRGSPKGCEPSAILQAVEGWIERALFDLQEFAGTVFNDFGDGLAVGGAGGQDFEDQHVQGALENVALGFRGLSHDACLDGLMEQWLAGNFYRAQAERFSFRCSKCNACFRGRFCLDCAEQRD